MHTFSRVLVVVMLSAGLAGAQEYETRTFTVREEVRTQRNTSGWQQTVCDARGNCTTQLQTSESTRELRTYFEQSTRWTGWRPWPSR